MRGKKLLEFCQENEIFVTNTTFYHRLNHKYTWTHPNQRTKHCFKYTQTRKRWISLVHNTKVIKSADFVTPHELILKSVFKAIIQPTVLYGTKCWVLKMKDRQKLQAFEMKCLRRLCKIRPIKGSQTRK